MKVLDTEESLPACSKEERILTRWDKQREDGEVRKRWKNFGMMSGWLSLSNMRVEG